MNDVTRLWAQRSCKPDSLPYPRGARAGIRGFVARSPSVVSGAWLCGDALAADFVYAHHRLWVDNRCIPQCTPRCCFIYRPTNPQPPSRSLANLLRLFSRSNRGVCAWRPRSAYNQGLERHSMYVPPCLTMCIIGSVSRDEEAGRSSASVCSMCGKKRHCFFETAQTNARCRGLKREEHRMEERTSGAYHTWLRYLVSSP